MNTICAAQAGQGGEVRVACINKATVDLGAPFDALTVALQKCFDQYFLPVWGYPVKLYNTVAAKPSDWQFIYFDNADVANALGYHDLTHKGQPVSKVFVKTTLADNQSVSVTACHELFEMVIDPLANLWAEASDGVEYAYEMSDPVEEDTFKVDGIEMSNFVHPSWFEPFKHPPGANSIISVAEEALHDDQGRLHDHQEGWESQSDVWLESESGSLRQESRWNHRSEYRKGSAGLLVAEAEADRPAAARPKSARAASRRRNLADRPHENERP